MTARFRRLPPHYLVVAACILLCGCFRSEQAKFPLASAAAPFGAGGRYVVYAHVDGDRYDRQEVLVLKRRPDGAYDFTNEEGKSVAISLHQIADDRFVGQALAEKDGRAGYGYVMFRVAKDEVLLYLPQCDEQDRTMLAAFDVDRSGKSDCAIDRTRDPAALFKRLSLGKAMSKLVRE